MVSLAGSAQQRVPVDPVWPNVRSEHPGLPAASPTTVTLKDVKGQNVGTVALTQYPAGVLIRGELTNLPPGWHAIHIHEKGVCEGSFDSAGAHLSAQGEQHGLDNPRPHAGDLPNIWVHDDGTAKFRDFFVDRLKGTLGEFLRWREVLLEVTYVSLRAFDLIGR